MSALRVATGWRRPAARSAAVVILRLSGTARHQPRLPAQPLHRLRFVGGRTSPRCGRRMQRGTQRSQAEHLRRQRPPQGFARRRFRCTPSGCRRASACRPAARPAGRRPHRRPAPPSSASISSRVTQGRPHRAPAPSRRPAAVAATRARPARNRRARAPPVTVCNARLARHGQRSRNAHRRGASATTIRPAARIGQERRQRRIRSPCDPASGMYCLGRSCAESLATAGRGHDQPVVQCFSAPQCAAPLRRSRRRRRRRRRGVAAAPPGSRFRWTRSGPARNAPALPAPRSPA